MRISSFRIKPSCSAETTHVTGDGTDIENNKLEKESATCNTPYPKSSAIPTFSWPGKGVRPS